MQLRIKLIFLILFLGSQCSSISIAEKPLLKILESNTALDTSEKSQLSSFFWELQKQYDFLQADNDPTLPLDATYLEAVEDFKTNFYYYLLQKTYDAKLPSVAAITHLNLTDLSNEDTLEALDLQMILQELVDVGQSGAEQLMSSATALEADILKLNKPNLVIALFEGLNAMWSYWGRTSRAAYCAYSHIPQLSVGLLNLNGGVACYKFTRHLVQRTENETIASLKMIRKNVVQLELMYKKIVAKNTLMGKILTGTLELLPALRRIHDIIGVGKAGYESINTDLRAGVEKSRECGTDFRDGIPQMIETAQNLTTCITFVDNTTEWEYDFLKPEEQEYY